MSDENPPPNDKNISWSKIVKGIEIQVMNSEFNVISMGDRFGEYSSHSILWKKCALEKAIGNLAKRAKKKRFKGVLIYEKSYSLKERPKRDYNQKEGNRESTTVDYLFY
jgi:hypothetical protein